MSSNFLFEAATAAKAGQLDVAADILRQAIARSPRDGRLHAELGRILILSNARNEGENALRRAVQLSPDDWQLQAQVGLYLDRLRQHKIAAQCYQRALALRPDQVDLWCRLGRMLRREGDMEASARALAQALTLDPNTADALHELGLVRWSQHRAAEARELCTAATRLKPDNVFYQSATASLDAGSDARTRLSGRPGTLRVGFHMNKPFHFSILHPVFAALRSNHHVCLTGEPSLLLEFDPQVVVLADVQARALRSMLPQAKFVYVRHGLTSKNHLVDAAASCDYFSGVTSAHIADMIVKANGFRPEQVWITGHVPLDPLFRTNAGVRADASDAGDAGDRADATEQESWHSANALTPGQKTVLFAPTWNRDLSAADLTRERTVELLRGERENINVIIKPHPHTARLRPDWHGAFRKAARDRANVWFADDPAADIVPFLRAADVLVSDVSSVIFSYLALDRPIILVTHPDRERDHGYDPQGIEWQWRDMGEEIFQIEDLPGAVARALVDPGQFAARRAHYRELMFGNLTDGRAAERIAARISELAPDIINGVRPH